MSPTRGSNLLRSIHIFQILDIEEIHFSLNSVYTADVRFELTTKDPWSCRRRQLSGISPWGYW